MAELPVLKPLRLQQFDYSTPGVYEIVYTFTKLTESGVRMPLGSGTVTSKM